MVIDSHQHFWQFDQQAYSWIDETKKKLQRDYLPSEAEPILKTNGIDGCVAVQARHSIGETYLLLTWAAHYDIVKAVVGWVDLTAPNVEDSLNALAEKKYLKGIRHILQAEEEGFMLRSDFQQGLAKLKEFGLSFDIVIGHTQLAEAIKMVESFPDQKFVLDHIAKPSISNGMDLRWKAEIETLAQNPNVYCKISGMVTETTDNAWKDANYEPFIDVVVSSFGYDRVMYGSDWPVSLLACEYAEQLDIVKTYCKQLSDENTAKLMGLNAVDFYNI